MAYRRTVLAIWLALLAGAVWAAGAVQVTVKLVDAQGQPVHWSTQEPIAAGPEQYKAPEFILSLPDDQVAYVLNMYQIVNRGGEIVALTPGVKVEGKTVTIDASAVDNAVRMCTSLAWAGKRLYVAEKYSIDGKDCYVHIFDAAGKKLARLEVLPHPLAVAASDTMLYIIGDGGLAAYTVAGHTRQYLRPLDYVENVRQMALIGTRLYVGDKGTNTVRVLNVETGEQVASWDGDGENALKAVPGLGGIGVAATAQGNLIVSDNTDIREFTPDGKFIRSIAKVKGGTAVAVDAQGNVGLAVPYAQNGDLVQMPEVFKFNAAGKLIARYFGIYMRGPDGWDNYRCKVFGGLLGKMYYASGVAFDPDGNLYVSDYNMGAQTPEKTWQPKWAIEYNGGVVKISPDNEFTARFGSRYTAEFIQQRITQRIMRPPLQRTKEEIEKYHRFTVVGFGDSISSVQGTWNGGASTAEKNWVNVLAQLVQAHYPDVKAQGIPMGIGGMNAAEGLGRRPGEVARKGNLILLQFGTNDTWFHHMTPAQYADALREAVKEVYVLSDSDVMIMTAGPLKETDKVKFREAPEDYIAAAITVGKELNVPVINMTAAMNRRLGDQPFEMLHCGPTDPHPNDAGHQVWAEIVMQAMGGFIPSAQQ